VRRQIFRSLELKFLNFPETRLNVVLAEGSLFLSKADRNCEESFKESRNPKLAHKTRWLT
jgi:hypothetical protein